MQEKEIDELVFSIAEMMNWVTESALAIRGFKRKKAAKFYMLHRANGFAVNAYCNSRK